MASTNEEVAALLREYAELLGLTGGDPFRARNYEKAAKSVGGYPEDLGAVPETALTKVPGVGSSVAAKIAEYRRTGTIKAVEELRAQIPPGAQEIAKVPGLGPKRALQLSRALGVASVADLEDALRRGGLRGLPGFGAKTEERLLRSIAVITRDAPLRDILRGQPADASAADIYAALAAHYGITARGAQRHPGSASGITARSAERRPGVGPEITARGAERGPDAAPGMTAGGGGCDAGGARGVTARGAQRDPDAVREITAKGAERDPGVGREITAKGAERDPGVGREITATSVERRPGAEPAGVPVTAAWEAGRRAASVQGEDLVQVADLRGDLHTHTDLTDGIVSLEGMIAAATARGYEYYAVTDHAPNLVMQRMTDEKMLAQREELRALADRTGMALLHGTELNIAPDGTVDWDEDFLAGFDICVASVHSHFDAGTSAMTKRFAVAAENPRVNVIGHPLTRKLGRRPPVDVDLAALYAVCARTGTALEINASPNRMDLPPEHIAAARDAGVKFAIDTDAHSLADLANMRFGVASAMIGGLTTDDVINAWPLDRLEEFLRKGRSS